MKNGSENTQESTANQPSYEELAAMYQAAQKKLSEKDGLISEQQKKIDSQEKQIARQSRKIDRQAERIAKLRKTIDEKEAIIKRLNMERFVNKEDGNAYPSKSHSQIVSEGRQHLPGEKKPKGRRGRKTGSKNYSQMDLEELSKGNPVEYADNLEELRQLYPDSEIVPFGEDGVTYRIDRVKAHIKVTKIVTRKYRVTEKSGESHVMSAPSKAVLNHSFAGASLLADLITVRLSMCVPIYRYYGWLAREGLSVDMTTVYKWFMSCAAVLTPVCEEMKRQLRALDFPVWHVDETYFKAVDLIGEGREHSFMFLISADKGDTKVRMYLFSETRETDLLAPLLRGFKGTLVVDGYGGYDRFKEDMPIQYCLEHCKRRFANIAKTIKDPEAREASDALKAVRKIDAVLLNEKALRERNLTPEEVLEERAKPEYREAIDECRSFLNGLVKIPKTQMGEAIGYYQRRSEGFFTFLNDGNCDATNNQAENCAKNFTTIRKNILFSKGEAGGNALGVLTTLVRTAEANGIYPDLYLEKVLEGVRDHRDVSSMMPWDASMADIRIPHRK